MTDHDYPSCLVPLCQHHEAYSDSYRDGKSKGLLEVSTRTGDHP